MSLENFEKNIFVNCPYDKDYLSLLKPLLFTILYFRYIPRLALESSDSGQPRLEKIVKLIRESKYSIHDLSRLQAKNEREFYRLNMPFELGLDFGSRKFKKSLATKAFLILGSKPHDYMKALSDINGLDIKNHHDIPEEIIVRVREWFIETLGLRKLDSPLKIWFKYQDFNSHLFEVYFAKYYGEYGEHTSTRMANQEIEKIPMPEYMDEIKEYLVKLQKTKK